MTRPATYVPPSGDIRTAKYIIVGEQPGKIEVINRKPFSGPSGHELRDNLRLAGINTADCYFTNVIKDLDQILGNYIDMNPRKGVSVSAAGQQYINQLGRELSQSPAKVIIALGNIALYALTNRTGITKWRGSILDSTLLNGRKIVPSVHPSTILRRQYLNKRLLIFDLMRAKDVITNDYSPLKRNIILRPSFKQSMNFLDICEIYGLMGNPIAYDIEVNMTNHEMTCISFAYSPTDAISIPFIGPKGDWFTVEQESEVLLKIAQLLENPKIKILGQNLSFDCTYMLRKYGIKTTNIHDTMVAQKTLLPDYPVGLHFICNTYTDLPYYKDDGKYWLKGIGNWDTGWNYNALDSIVCAEAYSKQLEALTKQQNVLTYERKRKSILPYVYIMEHGIKINLGSMKQAYDDMGVELDKTLKELHELCGFALNPNSPKQVKEYFYKTKRLPAYKGKSGGVTTDEKAMKRIARKGFKEASLILKLRGLTKERSTFLDPNKVDPDGRMRCSYNPVGTRFARASSSENIFGSGNNLQNQPHKILTHYTSDPYYAFYGMDLSQAENRIVAYEGRITQMIEAFENKADIHGLTAKIMMNIFLGEDKAKGLDPKTTKAPIGDGSKSWRDWGKKANHGLNYDLGYKTFSLYNEIPERDGKLVVNIYHQAYPGVRKGFHAYVQKCIYHNRTLTNLMGRKTVFTDQIGDALFKGAYSCIPQGTVGDVIDQRGLNFIYYNQDPLFKHVELMIQVHDQVGFQIPTPYHPEHPYSWEDHSRILLMIKESLEHPLYTHYKHRFVIPVDTTMGVNLNKDYGVDIEERDEYEPENLEKAYFKCTEKWLPVV